LVVVVHMDILAQVVETQLHLVLVFIYKEMEVVVERAYLLVQEVVAVEAVVLLGVVVVIPVEVEIKDNPVVDQLV
jgi:hypothetical protein